MPKLASKFQGKYWCFTLNNPVIEDEPPNIWPDVDYVIWQHERGENGTEHIQGYVCFSKRMRLSNCRESCSARAHWEPRNGTHTEAKHYCMKPVAGCDCKHCVAAVGQRLDGFWEHGDDSAIAEGQGQRSDLLACKALIDAGKTEAIVAQEHFGTWARHYKAFERYRKLVHGGRRDWITTVTVYWGPPGIGKSKRARYEAGEDAYWLPQPDQGKAWWDNYDGQEVVVIDEFYGWIKRTAMQRLCDSTPTSVENKGGSTPFLAKHIIITSNEPPSQWWKNIGLGPMERRLTGTHGSVHHMTTPWVEPPKNIIAPALTSPEAVDLMEHFAWLGTPPPEVTDIVPDNIHDQPPLARCPGCMRMMHRMELCDACSDWIKWGGAQTDHLVSMLED